MFKLDAGDSYAWTVSGMRPAEKSVEKFSFRVRFRRLTVDRQKELFEAHDRAEKSVADVLREVVCGWEGVGDGEGAELPFSSANLDLAVADQWVSRALIYALRDSLAIGQQKN